MACSNTFDTIKGCPDATISWVDVLKVNDIVYTGDDEGFSDINNLNKGNKIGEVNYMLADNACSNHKLRNGDAAFLPIGTEIYELAGYNTDFRVMANEKIYQVNENKNAETISDLYDIEGKVEKISLESTYDGSHISDFNPKQTEGFIEDFLSLEYVGFDKIYKEIKNDSNTFLRIHLNDGSSFRVSYWLEANALNPGSFGTEKMKGIVLEQKAKLE
jgi:hypothetical protein